MSTLDEIAKLKGLLDDGAITQDEYDAEKAKLLAAGGTAGAAAGTGYAEAAGAGAYTAPSPGGAAGAGPAPEPPPNAGQQQWSGQPQGQPNYGSAYGAVHTPGTPYNNYHEDAAANKVFGVLSYLWVLCFVSIFAAPKESHYTRFHANQGLVLFIFELAGSIVFGILGASTGFAVFYSHIGLGPLAVISVISNLYGLAMLILAIIGIVNAVNGRQKPLPVIGGITILGPRN